MSFDLNIQNYNKCEIEELFDVKNTNYNNETLNENLKKIKRNVSNNNNVTDSTKNKTLQFFDQAKNILVNLVEGSNVNVYEGSNGVVQNSNHFVIDRTNSSYDTENGRSHINPLKKDVLEKYINIDTRFRDNYDNTTPSNFTMSLPDRINNVLSVKLSMIEPPYFINTISEKLGNNYFHIDYSGSVTKITIPDGCYHPFINNTEQVTLIQNMLNSIQTQLSTIDPSLNIGFVHPNDDVASTDGTIHKIAIYETTTTGFTLYFNKDKDGNMCGDNLNNLNNSKMKLGWLLGFRKDEYEVTNSTTLGTESKEHATKFGVVSNTTPDINVFPYSFLVMDDFQNNFSETIISPNKDYFNSKNILSRISFISRENIPSNLNSPDRKYFGPVSLQKMKFQLVDQYNRSVDTNNIDFSFSLKVTCVYDI